MATKRDSILSKKAYEMISFVAVTSCADKSAGAWIKRYGDRFPLKDFKPKHFNHRIGKK